MKLLELFLSILTPKFGNLPVSGKLCAIEVACNYFENLPMFCLKLPYFLDVNAGISVHASIMAAKLKCFFVLFFFLKYCIGLQFIVPV